jgi:hypothetical protein
MLLYHIRDSWQPAPYPTQIQSFAKSFHVSYKTLSHGHFQILHSAYPSLQEVDGQGRHPEPTKGRETIHSQSGP